MTRAPKTRSPNIPFILEVVSLRYLVTVMIEATV